MNYFEINDEKTIFTVKFDEILGRENLKIYNDFDLTYKKTFNNIIETILNNYNAILLDKDGNLFEDSIYFIVHLLDAKHKLAVKDSMPLEEFIVLIDKIIDGGNKSVVKLIKNFVDEHYIPMNEKDVKKALKKKDWQQLAVKDDLAKNILIVAYFQCLITPIIAEYIGLNKQDDSSELETENICNVVFDHIINKSIPYPNRTKNKLYKLVQSRVVKMLFTGKAYWEKAGEHGIDYNDVIEDIYKKLITASLYKMDINMFDDKFNVVGYLQSIINNQIRFAFTLKFSENYIYFNPTNGVTSVVNNDDEDMAVDIVESALGQRDEGELIIERLNANEICDSIPQKLGVSATKEEVFELINKRLIKANPIQEQLVAMMTYKYFKSTETIKLLDAFQYSKLTLACAKYLDQHQLTILSRVLLSDCYDQTEKINIVGNKVKDKIVASKKWSVLYSSKYNNYQDDAEKAMLRMVNTICGSTFIDKNNKDIFENEPLKPNDVANEIISLGFII